MKYFSTSTTDIKKLQWTVSYSTGGVTSTCPNSSRYKLARFALIYHSAQNEDVYRVWSNLIT